jgi:hypothetical protein
MAEMIIPGTYITVRAEGLISPGRTPVGIVGVIGTAARGPVGEPMTLADFADARQRFGLTDSFNDPEDGAHPLTLVRALEHLYNNGATTVVGIRVASPTSSAATYAVLNGSAQAVAVLTADTPGSWGNNIRVTVAQAEDDCRIEGETHDSGFTSLTYSPVVPSPENQIRILSGITHVARRLNLVYRETIKDEQVVFVAAPPNYQLAHTPIEQVASVNVIRVEDSAGTVTIYNVDDIIYNSGTPPSAGEVNINTVTGALTFGTAPNPSDTVTATYAAGHAAPVAGEVLITTWDGSLQFAAGEAPNAADGDTLLASYVVDREHCVQVILEYETDREVYIAPDGNLLAQLVNARSSLAVAAADASNGGDPPAAGVQGFFGTGSNTPGSNGADAGAAEYAAGLESISNQLINIVVLAGQDAGSMGSVLESHLNATEITDYERIGVIGAPGNTLAQYLGHAIASDRIIVVAPGIRYPDGRVLPAAYTAAAVAGLISSLTVQTSLTNKTLTIPGLDANFNRGQQMQLIGRNVLSIVLKEGSLRVLKGITTEGQGQPFSAIPTRRIVDSAKYGVRSAANPYIGRLNNARVRAALQSTLEALLTRMVDEEALTGFELQVSATRAQEIAGEVSVIMTIQPSFSIDFIRVVMNLR